MATKKKAAPKKAAPKKTAETKSTGTKKPKVYTGTVQAWERNVSIPMAKDQSK